MADIWRRLWSDDLWFPSDRCDVQISWAEFENHPGAEGYLPESKDLHWAVLLGILLMGVRYLFERLIIEPIAVYCGVPLKPRLQLKENQTLEQEFKRCRGKLDYHNIQSLSKQTDLTCRQIEIWFRKRKQRDGSTAMEKIKECSWHFLFYGLAFNYGLAVLWNKPWLWETINCWIDYPKQFVDPEIYWYYVIELGFYWSLVFTVSTDHKRKDFKEMMVHHMATILLLYFSWVVNCVRVGSLVLLVHDAADPWLALAKVCKYMKFEKCTDTCFAIFFVIWIATRLVVYPYYILYSTTFEPYEFLINRTIFIHTFLNLLLYTLMVLHMLWSYSIFKIFFKKIFSGEMADVRSDSSDEVISEPEHGTHNNNRALNGSTTTKSNGTNHSTNGSLNGPKRKAV